QQASLLSFSSDAYLNEMGITNRFNLVENTSLGRSVAGIDPVPDNQPCASAPGVNCGEDGAEDINVFARFMRATKAPPRATVISADSNAGQTMFTQIGCNICHTPTITTAAVGTIINGGAFTVPAALGNKNIHPYSDFLLHDVGTGDGIVQNGGQGTRNKLRTRPLWGLRTRNRLMHDGLSFSLVDAIMRHDNEAFRSRQRFRQLNNAETAALLTFLSSL